MDRPATFQPLNLQPEGDTVVLRPVGSQPVTWHFDEGQQVEDLGQGRVRWAFPGPPLLPTDGSQHRYYGLATPIIGAPYYVGVHYDHTTSSMVHLPNGSIWSGNWYQANAGWPKWTSFSQDGGAHAVDGSTAFDGTGVRYFLRERFPQVDFHDGVGYLMLQMAELGHPEARTWRLRHSTSFMHRWSMPTQIWPNSYRYANFCITSDGGMATVAMGATSETFWELFYKWSPDPFDWDHPDVIGPIKIPYYTSGPRSYDGAYFNHFVCIRQLSIVGSQRITVTNCAGINAFSEDMGRTWKQW